MRAGSLDRRVTLQSKSVTRDAYGGESVTWADVATVWASVAPISGREFVQAGAQQDEVTLRVVIRWRSGVVPEMRLVYHEVDEGGSPTTQTVLDIVAVLPSEDRKRYIQLMCRRGVNSG